MHTTVRVDPETVLLPHTLRRYRECLIEPLVPLPAFDVEATEMELRARNVVLRDWGWRMEFTEKWVRQQEAVVRQMLGHWISDVAEPVLYYSKDGRMLGLGADCELGMKPQIMIDARHFLPAHIPAHVTVKA